MSRRENRSGVQEGGRASWGGAQLLWGLEDMERVGG